MNALRNCRVALLLAALIPATVAAAGKPYDVLDLPAVPSKLAAKSLMFSLTRVGDRIFATGIRGHILYSDDFGASWTQAEQVPVRSSLLDASFPTPEQGWVVGHEAAVLHTEDGGRTWVRQTDGRELPKIGLEYYQKKQAEDPSNERYAQLVDEMSLAIESGADRPLFRVHMRSPANGFVAGAYGMLFATSDGGKSWFPIMELLDLDQFVHLFDMAELPNDTSTIEVAGQQRPANVVGAGEMGTILALDPETHHWKPQSFPYEGSMFTLLSTGGDTLTTGGLRGLVFHSVDRGLSWQESDKPATGAVVASTALADGRVVIGTQDGNLLISTDHGASFESVPVEDPRPLSDLVEGRPGELVLSGAFGVRVFKLPAP